MANLPEPTYSTTSLENIIGKLNAPESDNQELGLKIQSNNSIVIENLQGVVDITQNNAS